MDADSRTWSRYGIHVVLFCLTGAAFALATPVHDLYTMNQAHHFLHGLAHAGYGNLAQDWYVGTTDPFPLFSALVSFTYAHLPAIAFHGYYALLLAVFAVSVAGIICEMCGSEASPVWLWIAATVVVAVYSAVANVYAKELLHIPGQVMTELFHGMAGHYLIKRNLEPATFGVLLLASVWLFLRGRPYAAVLVGAVGATVDAVYLLHLALLALSYMIIIWRDEGSWRKAATVGAVSALAVAPIVAYVAGGFADISPELSARASDISVHMRAPHHRVVATWFAPQHAIQIALCVAAIALRFRHPISVILLPMLLVIVASLILQMVSESSRLAMLMPWRLSVLTTPLSVAVLLSFPLGFARDRAGTLVTRFGGALLAVAVLIQCLLAYKGQEWKPLFIRPIRPEPADSLLAYIGRTAQLGDMYVVPPSLEGPNTSFRIRTGAPALVTRKIMPHSPAGTIEWYERMNLMESLYLAPSADEPLRNLRDRYGVTHVISPVAACARFDTLSELHRTYGDSNYVLYTFRAE